MAYGEDNGGQGIGQKVGGLIAAAAGLGFAKFVGIAFLIPLVIGGLAFVALRYLKPNPPSLLGMAAITIGQVGWFAIAVLAAPSVLSAIGLGSGPNNRIPKFARS